MDVIQEGENGSPSEGGKIIERARFEFGGIVPLLFGLVQAPYGNLLQAIRVDECHRSFALQPSGHWTSL
jgi:hypothetical protein